MTPPPPEPPAGFYEWVGRVTLAFALSELQLGMCGWTAKTGRRWTEDWTKVTRAPGVAQKLCEEALTVLPSDLAERMRHLLDRSRELRDRRNRLNHSALIFDPATGQASQPWLTRDARGQESALISDADGKALVNALHDLSRDADRLRAEIFKRLPEFFVEPGTKP